MTRFLAVGVMSLALASHAQTACNTPSSEPLKFSALVTDQSSAPLAGVEVRLISWDGLPTTQQITDAKGRANLSVPAGRYEVHLMAVGFFTQEIQIPPLLKDRDFSMSMSKGVGFQDSVDFETDETAPGQAPTLALPSSEVAPVTFLVTSASGVAIPEVLLNVKNDKGERPNSLVKNQNLITDRDGKCSTYLQSGNYKVFVSKPGFLDQEGPLVVQGSNIQGAQIVKLKLGLGSSPLR